MKFTRFKKITACCSAAGLTVLALSLITTTIPASAQTDRIGQLHIVKDCTYPTYFSGIPGSSYCLIESSNLPELPSGTKIYYNQITDGPTAGAAGFLDSTVFLYVNDTQWAVGRCTVANDNKTPGLCTLSDGVGPLAGFSARIVVTHTGGPMYTWDGTYRKSLVGR
jgi:hypothetical protein